MHNYYKAGEWNLICDVCGKKIKAGISKQRWDGFRVCPSCFEERHPQDFVRARQDKISVSFSRPIPTLTFTDVPYIDTGNNVCTFSGRQAIPMAGIPGCMIPSKINTGL